MVNVVAPISLGEALDKLTILEIKAERLSAPGPRANVRAELVLLRSALGAALSPTAELEALTQELKAVNVELWDIEEGLRAGAGEEGLAALARALTAAKDRRFALKRAINRRFGSALVEEKSYISP